MVDCLQTTMYQYTLVYTIPFSKNIKGILSQIYRTLIIYILIINKITLI